MRLIPTYHPIYRGADPEMLLLINDRLAHGRLRSWAAFTKTAADLCARQQVEAAQPCDREERDCPGRLT